MLSKKGFRIINLICSVKTWIYCEEKRGVGILFYLFTIFWSIEMLYFKFSTIYVNEKKKKNTNIVIILSIHVNKQIWPFLFCSSYSLFFFSPSLEVLLVLHLVKREKNFNLAIKFWRYCFGEKFLHPGPKSKRVPGKPQSWSAKKKIIGLNCF